MLIYTLKKMLRNKWMVLCLLIGSTVLVIVLSGVPTYTNGIFRNMLLRDLEGQQIREDRYPGSYYVTITTRNLFLETSESHRLFRAVDYRVSNRFVQEIGLPVLASRRQYTLNHFFFNPRNALSPTSVPIRSYEGFYDHIELVSGRLPQSDPTHDVIEFLLYLPEYQKSDIPLDIPFNIYKQSSATEDSFYMQAMCVGVFRINENDPYWYANTGLGSLTFVTDHDFLVGRYVETESELLRSLSLFYCFDYTAIRTEEVGSILEALYSQRVSVGGSGSVNFYMERTLAEYLDRIEYLGFMLQVLNVPVVMMLIFYIYMVSRLMVNHERNEIAVLKGRGVRNRQILSIYALESIIIASIALLAGPPLSLLICRVLGLSSGFMELVSRRGIPFELTSSAYVYGGIAAAGFILVMMAPIPSALKETIVNAKRKKGRWRSAPLWQKLFLDILLIAASLYSIRLYNTNVYIQTLTNAGGVDAPIDPLLLIASALFVLGAGLFFLRVFPFIVTGLFRINKRFLSPALYSALLSIVRIRANSQFLALFLILSIGLGLFYSTTARTINRFREDQIRYRNGSDIVMTQYWPTEVTRYRLNLSATDGNFLEEIHPSVQIDENSGETIITVTQVREPPFERVLELTGVSDATKVFNKQIARITLGGRTVSSDLIGIIPHEFGRVSWFRNDLLTHNFAAYLNLMTADPAAVFLSSSMIEHGFSVGDHIKISWSDQSNSLDATVYGFVDFWPSINPVGPDGTKSVNFVIANLNTIHKVMRMEPYSVWMRMEDGSTSAALYESINESDINVTKLWDANQEVIIAGSDPLVQGMNSTLTLGFIVTLVITFIGFLVYWVLSIHSRLLQFGIFRAMGMTKRKITTMLMWEQLFVSGSAIAVGFLTGALASRLFVPMFQILYTPVEQVPPFLLQMSRSDYISIFIAIGGMLVAGLVILTVIIRRLKVDQILKMGED